MCQPATKLSRVHALRTPLTPTAIADHNASELKRGSARSRVAGATTINPITPPTQSDAKSTWKSSDPIAKPWLPALLAWL